MSQQELARRTDLADALGLSLAALVEADPAYDFLEIEFIEFDETRQAAFLPSGLSSPSVPLVGRDAALEAIAILLDGVRSLTLTGPAGVGQMAQERGQPSKTVAVGEELQAWAVENDDVLGEVVGLALQSQGVNSLCATDLIAQDDAICHRHALELADRALDILMKSGGPKAQRDKGDSSASERLSVEAWIRNRLGVASQSIGKPDAAIEHYERALAIRRTLRNGPGVASTSANIAAAVTQVGDFSQAANRYMESLKLASTLGLRWAVYVTLIGLADLVIAQVPPPGQDRVGALRAAAMLLGAADALREKRRYDLYVHWLTAHERVSSIVGPATEHHFDWEAGKNLSFAEAVEFAKICAASAAVQ